MNNVDLAKIATFNQLTTQHLLQVNLAILRNQILSDRKHDDKRRLLRYGFRLYSKSEEDGIIQEIFRRIGIVHYRFVEIGAECGLECNTAKLLVEGWGGVWFEADPQNVDKMQHLFRTFIGNALKCVRKLVTIDNANELVYDETDILVIDVDGNDYWIWKAIEAKPRVVVIEYNPSYAPPMSVVARYNPEKWDRTNYFGASLEALVRLGQRKGYQLVGCDISGSNAFFVRTDEWERTAAFYSPATSENLYEPQRPYFSLGQYNPPSPRPFVMVEK